jgi:hypothetical protein
VRVRLEIGDRGYQFAIHEPGKILIDDQEIVLGSHPMLLRRVFICGACEKIRYKLFNVAGGWACYRCHHLTHASRHRNRTIPNWHRLLRLRRKINVDPTPFSAIAPRPRNARRYWRIVREIRAIEQSLLGDLRAGVCDVLERRDDKRRERYLRGRATAP